MQSRTLTTGDRELRTAVDQLTSRLDETKYVENVVSPLTRGGTVSPDKHSAFVIPLLSRRRPAGESALKSAVVDRVTKRPVVSLVVAGGLLLALAFPALNMKIVETSTDDLPQDLAVIKTYSKLRDAFPKEGVTADIAVKGDELRTGAASERRCARSLSSRRACSARPR